MNAPAFLKYKMNQVWLTRGCVCPCHVTKWTDFEKGYRFYNREMTSILLWYQKGKLLAPKRKKVKGKGFCTWLCRNYGIANRWAWRSSIVQRNIK